MMAARYVLWRVKAEILFVFSFFYEEASVENGHLFINARATTRVLNIIKNLSPHDALCANDIELITYSRSSMVIS